MIIRVLGSAAGGGVPQWNCNYRISRRAREGKGEVRPRLQSSIAAQGSEGRGWVLFNASPDIRQQINETQALQPHADAELRSSPIAAVVLTNADVDHLAGLLSLRERQAFNLYATDRVLAVLEANPIFRVLDPDYVRRITLPIEKDVALEGPAGPLGITIRLYPVPGKVALFMETGDAANDFEADGGDTVGVQIRGESDGIVHYVPGCARVDDRLRERVRGAHALLFDGTVFTDAEMAEAGVGTKTGRRMGHVPITGDGGSIDAFDNLSVERKIYIHINNTNPILEEASEERRRVTDAGWSVAEDGLELHV
ncbi:pyrroloquinoline quinone biosynthesis protein PqqB [Aureimonas mangrovi]|uniref:pyrroloquinoline quinone biosynthesis protein PqqB n=1 Tax=Aureimonas mangrovi TaxID=2758041 RepID=UPI00163D5E0F|nr:pyrroloquinoline quinone biosynthesis protein PqqB [Aureimonas mangrovi]